MNDDKIVNTNEMRVIAKNIRDKMDIINNTYRKEMFEILNESMNPLAYSNIKYDDMYNVIESDFNELEKMVNNTLFTLENNIIPSYENLNTDLQTLFNKDLSNELNNLLNIDN